jgi:hypothetical protein
MGYPKNEEQELLYEYDFAKDGGAVGEIQLRSLVNAIKEGVVIRGLEVRVKEAFASGGTPTVALGNSTDPDGYMADIYALGTLNNVINSGSVAGALIWDDTNDHAIHYRIDGVAANQDLVMEIGTDPLTAGKLEILVKVSSDGN